VNLQVNRSAALAAATVSASATVGVAVATAGPQAVGGVAGATIAIGLLRSPGVALALYLLVPPFLKGLLQPFVPFDLTVALGLACVAHVAYGIVAKPVTVKASALVLWLALLAMIMVGSLYAPDQGLAFSRVQNWIGLALLPLLVTFWVANDEREVERFIWTCLAVGLFVTLMALLVFSPSQQLLIGFTSTINVGRASLMVPFIVVFFVMKVGPRWMRGPLLLVLPLTLLVSFAAGARGPLLMFLVLVAMLSIWHVARGRRIGKGVVAGAVGAVLVIGVAVAVAPVPSVSADRFDRLGAIFSGGDSTTDGSVYLRLMAADLAVSMFESHPALGAGTGAFTHFSEQVPAMVGMENPHNVLLELASDWGVMGLLVFAVLVFAAIRRRPEGPVWTAVWVLFLFFLANDLLGSFFDNRPFWGLALLLLAAPTAIRSERRSADMAPSEIASLPLAR
jgi:O-antigen ligase